MFVTPRISREEAEDILSRRSSIFPGKRKSKKSLSLKRIELIYLPFYVFEVIARDQAQSPKALISLDGLLGDNWFFFKENLEYTECTDSVKYPTCPFRVEESAARRAAADKYKWFRLEYRFRLKEKLTAVEIAGSRKMYYPFWVGYFPKRNGYDFRLADAVSGEVQGVRMRGVFLKALRSLE